MPEVRHLDAEGLSAWRRDRNLVSSRPGSLDVETAPPVEAQPVTPLKARETYQSMMDQSDFPSAIRWLRTVMPDKVAHLTDDEIKAQLEAKIREAVTTSLRSRGLWTPIRIGGA